MKLYATRKDAKAEYATLVGWPHARIVRINTVADDGQTPMRLWAIECEPGDAPKYMQEDGYVR